MHSFEQIQQLADDALIQRLTHSVKGDRQLPARMLFEMGEVEARGFLTEAQDLLRNRVPDGDLEPIFEQALELLVAREKKRQFGQMTSLEPGPKMPRQSRRATFAAMSAARCMPATADSVGARTMPGWRSGATAGIHAGSHRRESNHR